MKDRILLFIPMYNCEKQIVRVLGQINSEIQEYITEIIVVNNRSTDNSEYAAQEYIEKLKFQVPVSILRNDENYGLGGSHKVAFQYAKDNKFDYIIVLHGDDQGHIDNILPYLKSGEYKNADCLLGARFMKGSCLDGYSKFRTFGNRVYNTLFSLATGKFIYDLGSGLNMYSVNMLEDSFYEKYKDNLMFNYCMILGSCQRKCKIEFFPIRWSEDDQISNVKMINQAVIVLKILALYIFKRKQFAKTEFRDNIIENYSAKIIYHS